MSTNNLQKFSDENDFVDCEMEVFLFKLSTTTDNGITSDAIRDLGEGILRRVNSCITPLGVDKIDGENNDFNKQIADTVQRTLSIVEVLESTQHINAAQDYAIELIENAEKLEKLLLLRDIAKKESGASSKSYIEELSGGKEKLFVRPERK